MYFFSLFADYDVVADVGVPVPPDFDILERFQDLVNVIFEIPNPLEELVSIAGVYLLFAFINILAYINCFSYISFFFCLRLTICSLFYLSMQC